MSNHQQTPLLGVHAPPSFWHPATARHRATASASAPRVLRQAPGSCERVWNGRGRCWEPGWHARAGDAMQRPRSCHGVEMQRHLRWRTQAALYHGMQGGCRLSHPRHCPPALDVHRSWLRAVAVQRRPACAALPAPRAEPVAAGQAAAKTGRAQSTDNAHPVLRHTLGFLQQYWKPSWACLRPLVKVGKRQGGA